jgi:hypothetical protein
MHYTFESGYARVQQFRVIDQERAANGRLRIRLMEVDGHLVAPTQRFWTSFFMRFGISDSVFRYFDPLEVFERISHVAQDDLVRYCIEQGGSSGPRLLAVSNPNRPIINFGEIHDMATRYGGTEIGYHDGVVSSTHVPRTGDKTFTIAGDAFQHRFVMETPIDGFSQPKIYLSFLRTICSNGAIGYSRAFRSDISLGKDVQHSLSRALESFDNGDGYAALRQRFTSAQLSWASVNECHELYKALTKAHGRGGIAHEQVLRDLNRVTGNLHEIYGLANLDALSVKRQRVLPSRARVYDLINFASEVATHHASEEGRRLMQGYIGNLISDEFDMEGTAETVTEFQDFFMPTDDAGPRPSMN